MVTNTCPISRECFASQAEALPVAINGQQLPVYAQPKEFGTKSIGWGYKGKITVEVKGIQVPCWVYLNVTAIGSKELPSDAHTGVTPSRQPLGETPTSTPAPVLNPIEPASDPGVEPRKQNGDFTSDQRGQQRYWNRCLKTMGEQDRDCGAAVSMYYERFHAPPKGLRYTPEQNQLVLPVRVFVSHWNIL